MLIFRKDFLVSDISDPVYFVGTPAFQQRNRLQHTPQDPAIPYRQGRTGIYSYGKCISRHCAINPPGFFSRIRLSTPTLAPKVRTLTLFPFTSVESLHATTLPKKCRFSLGSEGYFCKGCMIWIWSSTDEISCWIRLKTWSTEHARILLMTTPLKCRRDVQSGPCSTIWFNIAKNAKNRFAAEKSGHFFLWVAEKRSLATRALFRSKQRLGWVRWEVRVHWHQGWHMMAHKHVWQGMG